jgi:hypothetical protein
MTKRLVQVEWQDATSVDAWTEFDLIDIELPIVRTAGYVVRETDAVLVIANSILESDHACCCMIIPRAMILKIADLKLGE